MSGPLKDVVKQWTAKRKSALVIEILQGKMTVAEASRSYDLSPSEIEGWVTDIWTAEGWLYVAVVLDLFSRCAVGWSMKADRDASLVMDALMYRPSGICSG